LRTGVDIRWDPWYYTQVIRGGRVSTHESKTRNLVSGVVEYPHMNPKQEIWFRGWSGIPTWIQNKKFGFGLPRRQLWHFYHTTPSNVPSQCCDICATHDKKRCRFL